MATEDPWAAYGPPPPLPAETYSGRGSWYSQAPGWVDPEDRPRSNALGVPDEEQGIALPSRKTLGQWFDVTFPDGQTHRLQQTDTGPAGWTGRGIDISAAAARRAGYNSPREFPTDAQFSWAPAEAPGPTAKTVSSDPWAKYDTIGMAAAADEAAQGGDPWAKYSEPAAPQAPETPAAPPAAEGPGLLDYPKEFARQLGIGAVESAVAVPLRGAAPMTPETRGLATAIEAIQQGADIDEAVRRAEAAPMPAPDLRTTGPYQMGEAVSEAIGAKEPSPILHPVVTDIARGFGSVAGSIATAPLMGPVFGGIGEAAQAAVERGATPEQQERASRFGTTAGMTDYADLLLVTAGGPGKALGLLGRVGAKALQGAFIEGGQEGLQQFIQNMIAKGVYKPDQDLLEDVGYSAAIGAIVGGTLRAPAGIPKPAAEVPPEAQSVQQLTTPVEAAPGEKQPMPLGPEEALRTVKSSPEIPAGVPEVPPEGGQLFADRTTGEPGPIFYSKLLRAAEEKLPNLGTSQQMLATLRNQPGVKQEEIEDTGLEGFLGSRAKVSKQEVVEYLEENGVQVEEVYTTRDDRPPTWDVVPGGTLHDASLAPGPVQRYTELRLTIPVKDFDTTYVSPHWPTDPNVLAHVQFTTRLDKAGQPTLHIEGIQSDWHQMGRKYGYLSDQNVARLREIRALGGENAKQQQIILQQLTNLDAWSRLPGRTLQDIQQLSVQRTAVSGRLRALQDAYLALGREQRDIKNIPGTMLKKSPQAPFKSAWVELATKRMVRWAADNGYAKISWASPELAMAWNTGQRGNTAGLPPEVQSGLREFYGRIVPSRMKAVVKPYGGVLGASEIAVGPNEWARVEHVTIPDIARTMIQRGMAFYDQKTGRGEVHADLRFEPGVDAALQGPFRRGIDKVVEAFNEFAKKFGLESKIVVRIAGDSASVGGVRKTSATNRGVVWQRPDGKYEIVMFAGAFRANIAAFYTSLMHEFGHIIVNEKFKDLPEATKQLIREDFRRWRERTRKADDIEVLHTTKRPAGLWWLMSSLPEQEILAGRVSGLEQGLQDYFFSDFRGFHEYMADQVARWATTTAEPLSIVEKAWAGISKALRFFQEWMASRFGVETRPSLTIQNWLNSFLTTAAPMEQEEYARLDLRTKLANQAAVTQDSDDLDVSMSPRQPTTQVVLGQVGDAGPVTPEVKAAAAHADRITWLYRWAGSILDLAERNPRFEPLLRYVEKARDKDRMEREILDPHQDIAKAWQALGRKGSENLAAFLDDVTNMVYLTDEEKRRGVERHPTPDEINRLAKRYDVGREGLAVAVRVRRYTEGMLKLATDLVRKEAMKIDDPIVRAAKLDEINAQEANYLRKPYFPFMRFGNYYVLVKTAGGATRYFETFERKGLLSPQRQQQRKAEELRKSGLIQPDDKVILDKLPETATPFFGMPPHMLDLIKSKLNLTKGQLDALNQLRFQLSPAQSWRHFFQHKRYVPGYSQDFLRAFSRYAFHGARYIAKISYVSEMRRDIDDARAVRTNTASRIADFMQDHLDNTILDVKGDYGLLKGLMFLWAMGFSPAAASLNASQTAFVTFPFLAGHFGRTRALRTMTSVIGRIPTFYARGTYEGMQDWEMRGISHGIREGRIVETQAPIIAAMSQGGLIGSGATAAARTGNWILEKSGVLFELVEQLNRRIVFRAAMRLAAESPHAKIVEEAVSRYPREYNELQQKWGHSELEARAIVAAGHVTDRTQFVYAGWARPRFMRGRLGTIFIFKRYLQSLLFLIGSDKKFVINYMLLMAMMGGLGGLPYAEDIKNIIQAMLRWLGYNADVEKEISKLVKQYTDGTIPPDIVLHGLARRGFGIPALLDALGSIYTGRPGRGLLNEDIMKPAVNIPYPQFDRSRAVTSGPIVPREVWQALDPSKEVGEAIGAGSTQVLGYGFSAMSNLLKAITDKHLEPTDLKRWEKAMPRAVAGLSKMYRGMTEIDPNAPGFTRERSGGPKSGTTVVRYNIRDPEQFMELLGVGMGYNDLRRANEWNRIISQNEHTKYLDMKRQGLLESHREAMKSSPEETAKSFKKIEEFNAGLSEADKGKEITSKTIERSMEARERERIARERNIPRIRSNIPIAQEYERLYPRTIEMIPR